MAASVINACIQLVLNRYERRWGTYEDWTYVLLVSAS